MSRAEIRARSWSRLLRAIIVAFVLAPMSSAGAAELLHATVTRDAKLFSVEFSIRVDASASRLRELLDDYSVLSRLSPSTLSAKLIAPDIAPNTSNRPWVAVTMRPCILIFCKTLQKVSVIIAEHGGTTRYDSLPGQDNFRFARERLSISRDPASSATHSILNYTASLEPDFYVPPVMGPWIVRRVIVREMVTAASRAEQMLAVTDRNL